MDDVKETYRKVETGMKKTIRSLDGTDLNDQVGNVGDEARKDLGNLRDDARKEASEPQIREEDPAATANRLA
jgi:hypothetical protein